LTVRNRTPKSPSGTQPRRQPSASPASHAKEKTPQRELRGSWNQSLTMTYFHGRPSTIIGAKAFHCPVRDGKEWDHLAMVVRRNCLSVCPVRANAPILSRERCAGLEQISTGARNGLSQRQNPTGVTCGVLRNKSLTMTYFHRRPSTIIGAKSFHCPVRDGKEWDQLAMVVKRNWLSGCG
jgi:hypothetical protein